MQFEIPKGEILGRRIKARHVSRTRRRHQSEVQTPTSVRSPHGPHPPPSGAIFQAVDAFHALPPGDFCQARRPPAAEVTGFEQPTIVVFRSPSYGVDLVARDRLLEELVNRPEHVPRSDLVFPNLDRWPHILREPRVAHDQELIRLGEHCCLIGRERFIHIHEYVLARDAFRSGRWLRDVPHDMRSVGVNGIGRKPWREVQRKGAHGRRP